MITRIFVILMVLAFLRCLAGCSTEALPQDITTIIDTSNISIDAGIVDTGHVNPCIDFPIGDFYQDKQNVACKHICINVLSGFTCVTPDGQTRYCEECNHP